MHVSIPLSLLPLSFSPPRSLPPPSLTLSSRLPSSHPTPPLPSHPQSEDLISVKEGQVSRLQASVERMLRERDASVKSHLTEMKTLADERVSAEGQCIYMYMYSLTAVPNFPALLSRTLLAYLGFIVHVHLW